MTMHSIIFWNVQRLFGSGGSPIEHVLSGKNYKAEDLEKKLFTIASVIDRISEMAGPPLLVGLAEIENAGLCQRIADYVQTTTLDSVDTKGLDETGLALDGLNIGLLYNTTTFSRISLLRSHVINRTFKTRDILECDLEDKHGDKFSVLVNHWPSRLTGESNDLRISAAHYTANLFMSKTRFSLAEMWERKKKILKVPNKALREEKSSVPVVVMGDFNDEMYDRSIEILGSTDDSDAVANDLKVKGHSTRDRFRSYYHSRPLLLNPFWKLAGRTGSFYRSPRWRCYDQIMLSRGFLLGKGAFSYIQDSIDVFNKKEVRLNDGNDARLTNRNGKPISFDPAKNRGCSDHFPVFVSAEVK
jgi:hypothetical protein